MHYSLLFSRFIITEKKNLNQVILRNKLLERQYLYSRLYFNETYLIRPILQVTSCWNIRLITQQLRFSISVNKYRRSLDTPWSIYQILKINITNTRHHPKFLSLFLFQFILLNNLYCLFYLCTIDSPANIQSEPRRSNIQVYVNSAYNILSVLSYCKKISLLFSAKCGMTLAQKLIHAKQPWAIKAHIVSNISKFVEKIGEPKTLELPNNFKKPDKKFFICNYI